MVNILGVDIDNKLNLENFSSKVKGFFISNEQHYITTPNPEIILKAQEDEELFYILNKSSLAIADGFGLKLAGLLSGKWVRRLTGVTALLEILKIAEEKEKKVLIVNNKNGLSSSEEIESALSKKYPKLNFLIENCSFDFSVNAKKELISFDFLKDNIFTKIAKKIEKKINDKLEFLVPDKLLDYSPDVLICNFGAPYQEKFIFHNLGKLPTVKAAIGIGGALDFLTGKIKRAPKILRYLGLEWLWRLVKQPQRYKRIFRAIFVFPIKFFQWRFINPLFYRRNVICLLYRKKEIPYTALENKKRSPLEHYQVLLVERSEEAGHWQLPQGGIESNTIKRAGSRELYEELGIESFLPKKIYRNLFKYKTNHQGRYGFKGQKQSLLIAEYKGSDADIKLNFWDHSAWKWIKATDLVDEVYPLRKEGAKIFLKKLENYIETNLNKKYE
ncbi:MAG: WecB/TagA/CpsF family glycosyltransferase [Patescibacteria group bacterium]|jgi:N-acetylglucosaminyldiphosphoundecaprenol N-acetyl-beta-D-mannosaminyltransferase